MININNYQAYILDYYEGNLSKEQADMLISFLHDNPDLKKDFDNFALIHNESDAYLKSDKDIVFKDKNLLKKNPSLNISITKINEDNYEEFFSAYLDNELSSKQEEEVEAFIKKDPVYARELTAWKQTKLEPDKAVVFPNKKALKHHVIGSYKKLWLSISAAAVVFIIASLFLDTYFSPDLQQHYVEEFQPGPFISIPIAAENDEAEKTRQPVQDTPGLIADATVKTSYATKENEDSDRLADKYDESDLAGSLGFEAKSIASIPSSNVTLVKNTDIHMQPASRKSLSTISLHEPVFAENRPGTQERNQHPDENTLPGLAIAELQKRTGITTADLTGRSFSFWDLVGTSLAAISQLTGNPLTVDKERDQNGNITYLAIGDNFAISRDE